MSAGIRKRLRELGDRAIAAHSQRFFKTGPGEYGEGDQFVGVRVPVLRKLAREYKDLPLTAVTKSLRSKIHEERLLALLILIHQFACGDGALRKKIYELYLANTAFINNWDLVDVSAGPIIGAWLSDRNRKILCRLARSEQLWERRVAIMATFHFIKQNQFDDTLKIARLLLQDDEDLIHKAVGWMLREIGKRDLAVEESFLAEHYKHMPRTMLRYAIERFPVEKRRAYLCGEVSVSH